MRSEEKIYTLKPEWKYNLLPYIFSIILLPVFGLGIIVYWYYKKRIDRKEYQISNDKVTEIDNGDIQSIAIMEIEALSVTRTWSEQKGSLGTLHISGAGKHIALLGIDRVEDIQDALEMAIANEKLRQSQEDKSKSDYPDVKVGGLEQMNNLVGLWQQGLISNEDFEKEKDKFSS
ncbi:MAG TPA: PH domain-containing protein [Balneolales bacterium]|nr:PH domain-containing protein [Balneolales bacterium]